MTRQPITHNPQPTTHPSQPLVIDPDLLRPSLFRAHMRLLQYRAVRLARQRLGCARHPDPLPRHPERLQGVEGPQTSDDE